MDRTTEGWLNGAIGILIFSGSLPATRVAVAGFDPMFVTASRASVAGLLAICTLAVFRDNRPTRHELLSLVGVALGVVVGFPLLSALALTQTTSAHSLVFVGLLPLTTAAFGVLRGGERPRPGFWACALAGAGLVAGFAWTQGGGAISSADLLMLGAIVVAGFGYAEGGLLSRRLGGWRVICWALTLSLPAILAWTAADARQAWSLAPTSSWLALIYVSLFSMLIGFVFWYRGLALGGIAAVGQLQLLQPLIGLGLAALLLGERVEPSMLLVTLGVVAAVAGAKAFAK